MQQNDIDDYTVLCYLATCTCTEIHYLTGRLYTKCEEINGDENAIQKQLIANATDEGINVASKSALRFNMPLR